MYVFLLCMLFINIFLMSKVFVFLLEVLLNSVVIPFMNWTNKLHQNMYRLELRKVMIENNNNATEINNNDSDNESDNTSDISSETSEESSDESENDIKYLNKEIIKNDEISKDIHFIDEKLD
jgi:hypothetical protein